MNQRSAWSGGLLAMSCLYPMFSDAINIVVPMFFPDLVRSQFASGTILAGMLYPHTLYHASTAALCGFLVAGGSVAAVVAGPYRRGERWSFRLLVYASVISLVVRMVLSFTVYMHPLFGGLEQDVQIPLAFLVAGIFMESARSRRVRAS